MKLMHGLDSICYPCFSHSRSKAMGLLGNHHPAHSICAKPLVDLEYIDYGKD